MKSWQVLAINCVVILVCGVIAISLPIILRQQSHAEPSEQPPANQQPVTTIPDVPDVVHCDYVGAQFINTKDHYHIWQLSVTKDDVTILNWSQIYNDYLANQNLITAEANLHITKDGLTYYGDQTLIYHYVGWVTYQGQTLTVKL